MNCCARHCISVMFSEWGNRFSLCSVLSVKGYWVRFCVLQMQWRSCKIGIVFFYGLSSGKPFSVISLKQFNIVLLGLWIRKGSSLFLSSRQADIFILSSWRHVQDQTPAQFERRVYRNSLFMLFFLSLKISSIWSKKTMEMHSPF